MSFSQIFPPSPSPTESIRLYFNWRIIILQYCDSFCHASIWIVHRYTYVPSSLNPIPPPSPTYPSRLSQRTGFESPASYIKLALVIYFTYGNIYVSMLFSQIIPPFPSPTESKSLSLHLCLLCCPACRIIGTIFLDFINICINICSLSFSFWLIAICITGSRFIHPWCEELTNWKRPWYWERLKTGGEGDDRGWDGWMVSLAQWTWVWASSRSWWWTGKPGMLHSMGLQRIRHDWVTKLKWYVPQLPYPFICQCTSRLLYVLAILQGRHTDG